MIVKSFFSKHGQIHPLEVEVKLTPGLPQLQVIGLPDTALKESSLRIKTAIKSQGFEWPKGRQVIVNLRPAHIRKHSQGLELAIACALLWETKQVPKLKWRSDICIYGELGLGGEVLAPADLESIRPALGRNDIVLCSSKGILSHKKTVSLSRLSDLADPHLEAKESEVDFSEIGKKEVPELFFSKKLAMRLRLAALSGASTLLAGPPGSGKTTFAESLHYLLPPLSGDEFLDLRAHHLQLGVELNGRPLVSPHHSTPVISLIGGGSELFPGEIAKAHGGLLILDEFLLFPSRVIEALREPLVSKRFRVSRRGQHVEWPADFQFVATTNLCPCGKLGTNKNFHCGYTIQRCKSVLQRLSGPMLDRFDLILLLGAYKSSHSSKEELISLKEIQSQVNEARAFAKECSFNDELRIPKVYQVFQSRRREQALKKLAKALALLEGRGEVGPSHWTEAFLLSQKPIEDLQRLF